MKKIINVTMKIAFNGSEYAFLELEKTLDHRIEGLIDIDNWPEIERIYGVEIEEEEEK